MRHQSVTIVSVLLAVVLLPVASTSAGKLYFHLHRTRTKCCLPKHHYGHDTPRFGASDFAVANAAVGPEGQQRKPFHFRAIALTVDQLQLDQIGLAIYESEERIIATGRITHNGGDGGLIGNNVTIRVRAYVASSPDSNQIPPDAVVIWQSERKIWVSRDRPEFISLVPASKYLPQPTKLARHFDEITHLEVEMEFKRDR